MNGKACATDDELVKKVYISEKEITKIIDGMAEMITSGCSKKKALHFVTVLDGALYFAKDLISNVEKRGYATIQDFIRIKSYAGTSSTGDIKLVTGLKYSVIDHDVMVLEDIVESGHTMVFLKDFLLGKKASSVKIATFLDKPCRRKAESLKLDYVGKEIPNVFVIGYGMDLDGKYRDLPYISYVEKE